MEGRRRKRNVQKISKKFFFKKKLNLFLWQQQIGGGHRNVLNQLKQPVNLRYKGLVNVCLNNNYIFLQSWEWYFLRKACLIIETISYLRGVIFLIFQSSLDLSSFYLKSLQKKESRIVILPFVPIPGYISNFKMYGAGRMFPDLVIYLVDNFDFINSIINEALRLRIPLVAPIGGAHYYNIPYPILFQKQVDWFIIFFLKSILAGLIQEKLDFNRCYI